MRGRNVMRGYCRAPDLTGKVIDSEGWFNTGYVARFDGDCLHILGRTKEMIIGVQRLRPRSKQFSIHARTCNPPSSDEALMVTGSLSHLCNRRQDRASRRRI